MKFECCLLVFVLASGVMTQALKYDFERDSIPQKISPKTSLTLDDSIFKKGSQSLKWQWSSGDRLTWDIASKNIAAKGGIKIWIYNPAPISQKCLSICVRQIRKRRRTVSCFPFSLDFKGWRAAWVSYKEFLGCRLSSTKSSRRKPKQQKIKEFFLVAPSNVKSPSPLYIDFLQIVTKISLATRDSIVPPLTYEESGQTYCTSCSKVHSKLSEEAALSKHPRRRFWQQIYRWSVKTPSPPAAAIVDTAKLTSIKTITERLVNWYAGKDTTFTRIPHTKVAPTNKFVVYRWKSLLSTFDNAHSKLKLFTRDGSDKPTSGLFSRNDKSKIRGGNEEFSYVHHKVLLPLTLEYHIRSRKIEVQQAACDFATEYQCQAQNTPSDADIEAITGKDSAIKNNFTASYNALPTSSSSKMHANCSTAKDFCFEHVKRALEDINEIRKQKIIGIFAYLKDQGLAGGSGLGSMDHELLQMSGYFHSIFLMRNELGSDIIDAMKWYSEFGEVYQTNFEYQGTTADRARSAMLYRLMTVLSMPEKSNSEKSEKIRDMDALKNWIENALSINEGLSGLIKPDYTCFHHKTFYASSYCPQALHTAALLSYLLEGTDYTLSRQTKINILNTLKVFRIAAVYYSTPSQVGGRFPKYNKATLAEHVAAFAYMAINESGPEHDTLIPDLGEVRMFLRLYKPVPGDCTAGVLNSQLCKGTTSRIYYLNTLGSLEIMERVKKLTMKYLGTGSWHYTAEPSQSGHWTKQFAALSMHRRDDWAVTVKGLDKYVWDFENGGDNIYGMYGSHGAMLIANSESALNSKDVERGWDWRKIPGTTVVNVPYSAMSDISRSSSRHYNPSDDSMAGGVFFKGSQFITKKNGVFGMNFKKPPYKLESGPFHNVDFSFQKSVFFYDDIVVSLGSNIKYSGGQYEVHTTLFQDLMPQQSGSSKASATASNVFRCTDGGSSQTNQPKTDWSKMALAILVDVNGNRYYIPNPDKQGLVLSRNITQQSPTPRESDPQVTTSGIYCTAWLNHGTNPNGATSKYEYAVQIQAETSGRPKKEKLNPQMRYTVIKREDDVHVVKFKEHSNRGAVYGYVVFPAAPTAAVNVGNEGPIRSVLNQSVIMAEEITNKMLFISVQSTQLNLQKKSGSPSWCEGTTSPSESNDVRENLLFCSKSTGQSVHVNLRDNAKWSSLASLFVGGKDKSDEKGDFLVPAGAPMTNPIEFINLRNGAETEVAFG